MCVCVCVFAPLVRDPSVRGVAPAHNRARARLYRSPRVQVSARPSFPLRKHECACRCVRVCVCVPYVRLYACMHASYLLRVLRASRICSHRKRVFACVCSLPALRPAWPQGVTHPLALCTRTPFRCTPHLRAPATPSVRECVRSCLCPTFMLACACV